MILSENDNFLFAIDESFVGGLLTMDHINQHSTQQHHQLNTYLMLAIPTSHAARSATTHRCNKANTNNPTQAPSRVLPRPGTQPWNHRISPGVKWKYGTIFPEARGMGMSMAGLRPFVALAYTWAWWWVMVNMDRTGRMELCIV